MTVSAQSRLTATSMSPLAATASLMKDSLAERAPSDGNLTTARHVYESEGFVVEGVLRECLKAEGSFESPVVMSMLRDEYIGAR